MPEWRSRGSGNSGQLPTAALPEQSADPARARAGANRGLSGNRYPIRATGLPGPEAQEPNGRWLSRIYRIYAPRPPRRLSMDDIVEPPRRRGGRSESWYGLTSRRRPSRANELRSPQSPARALTPPGDRRDIHDPSGEGTSAASAQIHSVSSQRSAQLLVRDWALRWPERFTPVVASSAGRRCMGRWRADRILSPRLKLSRGFQRTRLRSLRTSRRGCRIA